jgi:hypothetical protein
MQVKRLVAFGDSNTYGHALPDCFVPPYNPGPKPSEFSYANVAAQLMGVPCVNLGIPGNSNRNIMHQIVNFEFMPDDFCVVQWSYVDRTCFFTTSTKTLNILANDLKFNIPRKLYYQHFHSDYDSWFNYWQSIYAVEHVLNQQNIKFVQFDPYCDNDDTPVPPVAANNYLNYWLENTLEDVALDNQHFGPKTHARFGAWLKDQIVAEG